MKIGEIQPDYFKDHITINNNQPINKRVVIEEFTNDGCICVDRDGKIANVPYRYMKLKNEYGSRPIQEWLSGGGIKSPL